MLKEELGVDAWVNTQNRSASFSPNVIDRILTILELKYDEDENI